jgi:hypothetical protein
MIATKKQGLVRKFIGFFQGQLNLVVAETKRRNLSIGDVVREIFDLGTPHYREMYKLPPTYPDNQIDITNPKNF